MLTCATLFSGCGGADAGLRAAGFEPIWAIERDPDIAAIYKRNFGHYPIVDSIENVDPHQLSKVDLIHASPPCQNWSVARDKSLPKHEGADAGYDVAYFIDILQPRFFTLENVEGYKKAESFKAIVRCLKSLGYFVDWQILNAADFGVPQRRRRLILRACRDGLVPKLPPKTPWMGWYEAIEDLIPTLPECELAPWQKRALPPDILELLLVSLANSKAQGKQWKVPPEPSWTVATTGGSRAVLVGSKPKSNSDGSAPASTIATNSDRSRAVLVAGGNQVKPVEANDPAFTVLSSSKGRTRAVLVPRVGARLKDGQLRVKEASEVSPTVKALGHDGHWRQLDAVLFYRNGARTPDGRLKVCNSGQPAPVVKTASGAKNVHQMDAIVPEARVLKMTPRALARFQSFPDSFWFPENPVLATRAIGNAVPPKMMEAIALSLLSSDLIPQQLQLQQLQLF